MLLPVKKPRPPMLPHSGLTLALAHIDRNYASVPSNADMAHVASMSEYHFNREFKRHYGETPKRRVDRLRMTAAEAMLLRGDRIVDVAEALGYAHQSHLTAAFAKAHNGTPPARWRRATETAKAAVVKAMGGKEPTKS